MSVAEPFRRLGWLLLATLCAALTVSILSTGTATAAPASPDVYTLHQPSGDSFKARNFGDEWYNGVETRSGYTIVKDNRGRWTFAVKADDGSLRASNAVVGRDRAPAARHLRDRTEVRAAEELQAETEEETLQEPLVSPGVGLPGQSPSIGTDKSLIILAQFNDQTNLGTTPAQWHTKYFGATDSVKDYYEEVSYGQFSIAPATEAHGTANDGVVGWVTLNMAHPNKAGIDDTNRQVTIAAIQAANPYVDYASYDTNGDGHVSNTELHVTVIAAGQEASCCQHWGQKFLWGHRWSLWGTAPAPVVDGKHVGAYGYTQFGELHGNHQAAIGIMVHEIGHDLDWPDLYDGDNTSEGVGSWSVMGAGSWNKIASDAWSGDTPPHPDAWSKWFKGWITPTLTTGTTNRSLVSAATASTTNGVVQMLPNAGGPHDWTWQGTGAGEYFLVENRQRVVGSYDESLPGNGLLVMHINEALGNNNTDANRLVDIAEADALRNLDFKQNRGDAGDVYPGTANNRAFSGTTNPNSNLNSGAASGVSVSNISDSGLTMSATFTAPGGGGGTAPSNDSFAQAIPVTERTFTATLSNTNATVENGELAQSGCPLGRTVWYSYTPQSTVLISANTEGSDFDTVLSAWRGTTLAGLQAQACNDDVDGANARWSRVPEFVATAGTTYYFQVGGYYDSAAGTVAAGNLSFNLKVRPSNDDYANARVISGVNGSAAGNNTNATKETGEQNHGSNTGGSSVWYRWTAPTTGTATFDTVGSTVNDTLLGVYTGTSVTGASVAQNDDLAPGNGNSRVQFAVTAGTVYSIAIDGYGTAAANRGEVALNWSVATPASANLALQKDVARSGNSLTYTIGVSNAGPDTAQAVTVTDTLPAGVTYTSATPSSGSCSGTTTVTCNLGAMANGGTGTVTIVVSINGPGTITNTASVSSTTADPANGNNSDNASITIEPDAQTDLAMSGALQDTAPGHDFSYQFTVSRAGAADSSSVVATFAVPTSLRLDAISADQGTCTVGGTVSCDLGIVAKDGDAVIELVVTPRTPGPHTVSGSVPGGDPTPGDNQTSVVASAGFVCTNTPTNRADVAVGTAGPDILCGLGGPDRLEGRGGDDLMFGGPGIDVVTYANSTAPMIVNLNFQTIDAEGAWPKGAGVGDGRDYFSGIEQVMGSAMADKLLGHLTLGNTLWGLGGADVVYGYGGVDSLYGNAGNDALYGGDGLDHIFGAAGNDLCRDASDNLNTCER